MAVGGEFWGRPLFLGHPRGPLACIRLSTTALGNLWLGVGVACFHPGPPFPVLPGTNPFGPGLCPWGRDLLLQSTS